MSDCASCQDANTCEKCDPNYELHNNQCSVCPTGRDCKKPKSTKTAKSGKLEYKIDYLHELLAGLIAGAVIGAVIVTGLTLGISIKWYLKRRLTKRNKYVDKNLDNKKDVP